MSEQLIRLRQELHRRPELSGSEAATARRVRDFLREQGPVRFIDDLGYASFAAVYDFPVDGPTIMLRCELDALPITEANTFAHRSTVAGVSHKCGHDGHMVILCGVGSWLAKQDLASGRVILLFQSAEETGEGARRVVESPGFRELAPDYVLALHNIPGAPLHQTITVAGSFSMEVQSFALTLTGVACHAAEPEKGVSPAAAMAVLIGVLASRQIADPHDSDYALLTPVHLKMGTKAYGISPADGSLHYTIRTRTGSTMRKLVTALEQIIERTATDHRLGYHLDWFEHFPATRNDQDVNGTIASAARAMGATTEERSYPFPFGEDFGWFSGHARTAMFGLGAGTTTPPLHHPDYDFPDELIPTGTAMFSQIITHLLPGKGLG